MTGRLHLIFLVLSITLQSAATFARGEIASLPKEDNLLFLEAVSHAQAEIRLASIAQKRAASVETRDLALQVVKEQTLLLEKLKKVVPGIPNSTVHAAKSSLKSLHAARAADFDRTFLQLLARHRSELIKQLEQLFRDGANSQLRSIAGNHLPSLRGSYRIAVAMANSPNLRDTLREPAGSSTRQ